MKFRYYITNLFDGKVEGANDTVTAEGMSCCEEFFVVDSETGEWLQGNVNRESIQEVRQ